MLFLHLDDDASVEIALVIG